MTEVTFDDFQKLDIRIGTIEKAQVPEWSHWVMRLEVNFDVEIGKRIIFAGIMNHYKPEEVEGRQAPFIVNLKPKRIGPADEKGEYNYSQGMMLMGSVASDSGNTEDEVPVFLNIDKKVPEGTKVR